MNGEADADARNVAEIEKLRAEAEALRRAPHFIWTNWIPLIGGVAALITALFTSVTQWRLTDIKIEKAENKAAAQVVQAERRTLEADKKIFEADKELRERQANIADLRKIRSELESQAADIGVKLARAQEELRKTQTQLQNAANATQDKNARQTLNVAAADAGAVATAIARQKPIVYLQFRGAISRDTMRGLQADLRDTGFNVPGIERTGVSFATEVRYFNEDDAADAKEVAKLAAKYFLEKKCTPPLREIPAKFVASSKPPKQIEVWVYLNCGES